MPDLEEQNRILRVQGGDRTAFEALVECYWASVYRWLYGLTHNSHAAEDLTQETFLKCWGNRQQFRPGTNFRAWLFRIARNSLTDTLRAPAAGSLLQPDTLTAPDPGPMAAALRNEGQVQVRQALARLPLEYRGPFLLRVQEDLSFQEIAEVLALTEETARWRVFKARQLLLKELGSYLDR